MTAAFDGPDIRAFTGALITTKESNAETVRGYQTLFRDLPPEKDTNPYVFMTGSSTVVDLYGDTVELSALQDMADLSPVGMSIWLNHAYDVEQTWFGKLVASPVIAHQANVADLHLVSDAAVKNNVGARQVYTNIHEDGATHGCSAGFNVTEYTFDGDADDWWAPLIIIHLLPLEYSIVGIPANPRSWVEQGIKSLFEKCVSQDRGEEAIRLAPHYKGFYRTEYKSIVGMLDATGHSGLRKELERRPARPSSPNRITWEPMKRTFLFIGKGGRQQILKNVDEVNTALKAHTVVLQKGACGKTSWPLADRDAAWDGGEAKRHLFEWAGGDDFEASKAKQVFLWVDAENSDTKGAYKLPFCDDRDGIKIIPKGVFAVAGALNGARGTGVDIPEEDIEKVKAKVSTIYARMRKEFNDDSLVPEWEKKEDEKSMKPNEQKTTEPEETPADPSQHVSSPQSDTTTVQHDATLQKAAHIEQYNTLGRTLGFAPVNTDGLDELALSSEDAIFEAFIATIRKASALVQKVKEGKAISAENSEHIKTIHDMCCNLVGTMHCSAAMEAAKPEDRTADTADTGDDQMQAEKSVSVVPALTKGFTDLAAIFEGVPELIRQAAINGMAQEIAKFQQSASDAVAGVQKHVIYLTKEANNLDAQFKKAAQQINAVHGDVQTLLNRPLGKPTGLNTKTYAADPLDLTAKYEDMLQVNQQNNETLPEALVRTKKVARTLLDGTQLQCRHWPTGVGGTVEKGVRPPLTLEQKTYMPFSEWSKYDNGDEAFVPLIDDPSASAR